MGSPDLRFSQAALTSLAPSYSVRPEADHTATKMPKKANIFDSFSHSAIQQFKEAFGIMDVDKDGLLSASDLTTAFANKFSASEVDDAFAEFKIDGGMIDAAHLKGLM